MPFLAQRYNVPVLSFRFVVYVQMFPEAAFPPQQQFLCCLATTFRAINVRFSNHVRLSMARLTPFLN